MPCQIILKTFTTPRPTFGWKFKQVNNNKTKIIIMFPTEENYINQKRAKPKYQNLFKGLWTRFRRRLQVFLFALVS